MERIFYHEYEFEDRYLKVKLCLARIHLQSFYFYTMRVDDPGTFIKKEWYHFEGEVEMSLLGRRIARCQTCLRTAIRCMNRQPHHARYLHRHRHKLASMELAFDQSALFESPSSVRVHPRVAIVVDRAKVVL